MSDDALLEFERTGLERLKLAADVILSETDAIPACLEAELVIFKERVERALLLPGRPRPASPSAVDANGCAGASA